MAIKMVSFRDEGGEWRCGPRVFCDFCKAEIRRAEDGWYWWKVCTARGMVARQPQRVYFAHKPRCNFLLERKMQADGSCWACEELSRFPQYLENVLHVNRNSPYARLH